MIGITELVQILGGIGVGVAAEATYSGLRTAWSYLPARSDLVRKKVAGTWTGDFDQSDESGKKSKFKLTLVLSVGRKRVRGHAQYQGDGTDTTLSLQGGFVESRMLVLGYENTDPAKRQHGKLILRLSNNADSLEGGFVGLGVITDRIVFGPVQLTKKQDLPARA